MPVPRFTIAQLRAAAHAASDVPAGLSLAMHAADMGDSGQAPEWVQLVPEPPFQGRDGRGPFTYEPAALIAASRVYHGATDIPGDYDHQMMRGAANGQPAPASAWVTDLEHRPGQGIWGRVKWTPRAAAHIAAGEYRYLSPVIPADRDGRLQLIHSFGLVNKPNLDVVPVSALHAAMATFTTPAEGGSAVDPKLQEFLTKIGADPSKATADQIAHATSLMAQAALVDAALQGLGMTPEEAKPEAVAAALSAHAASMQAIAEAAGLGKDAKLADIKDRVVGLALAAHSATLPATGGDADPNAYVPRAEYDRLAAQVKQLTETQAADAAHSAVSEAMEAGKLAPASKAWALDYATKDLEGFKKFAHGAPVIVAPGSTAGVGPTAGPGAGDAHAADVARALGITPEAMAEANKEAAR